MNRKNFLQLAATLPLTLATMKLRDLANFADPLQHTEKMPVLFIGHGNPMNAITQNPFKTAWEQLGKQLPTPKAILCISAHWLTNGTKVTMMPRPRTIHDFGGFPKALFDEQYPVAGAPDFAKITMQHVKKTSIEADFQWGLDHGAWCVLKPMFPKGDIPIFQLSLDFASPPQYHYELAKELAFLRTKGVLIVLSGNVVHNLMKISWEGRKMDWAIEFDMIVKNNIESRNHDVLVNYSKLGNIMNQAHPSVDHYLPLLYALALREQTDDLHFFNESFDLGSISMRSFIFS